MLHLYVRVGIGVCIGILVLAPSSSSVCSRLHRRAFDDLDLDLIVEVILTLLLTLTRVYHTVVKDLYICYILAFKILDHSQGFFCDGVMGGIDFDVLYLDLV